MILKSFWFFLGIVIFLLCRKFFNYLKDKFCKYELIKEEEPINKPIGWSIYVSSSNVAEMSKSYNQLVSQKDKLIEAMKDYPLEISFVGYRFLLINKLELETLIFSLDEKLKNYNEQSKT